MSGETSALAPNYTGHCLCAAVKVEVVAQPKWVSHCHCPSCQKATSAAFATYVGFERGAVRFIANEPKVFKSSPGVVRRFCADCGSPVSFEGEAWPGEIHLHASFLDQAKDIMPEGHTFVKNQLPWVKLDDALPRLETFPRDEK